jgi:hypothetical protein
MRLNCRTVIKIVSSNLGHTAVDAKKLEAELFEPFDRYF